MSRSAAASDSLHVDYSLLSQVLGVLDSAGDENTSKCAGAFVIDGNFEASSFS